MTQPVCRFFIGDSGDPNGICKRCGNSWVAHYGEVAAWRQKKKGAGA